MVFTGNYLTGETEKIEHRGGAVPFERAHLRGSSILEFVDLPCSGLSDRHEQRAFEEKDGIQQIPPGGALRAAFTLTGLAG